MCAGAGGLDGKRWQLGRCSAPATGGPPAKLVPVGDFFIAQPVRCKNLTVFPVLSRTPKNEDRYITLEEGLKSDKVAVYEVGGRPGGNPQVQGRQAGNQLQGGAANVNHLMVLNRSIKSLYLMPGEIICGGKQDRCVAKEYVIAPGGKPVKIEVYCVEHGRWAFRGAFAGKAGNLNKAGRVAVQGGKGQQEVWDSVGKSNVASGARTSTDAFTANYTDPKILKMIDFYVKDIERPVAESPQVVGAIVAVGDKIEVIDVFGSTPLFQKVWPKLLKGHALDAAVAAPKKTAKHTQAPTLKDAKKFFQTAMQADVQQKTVGKDGLVVTKRESKDLISYSAAEKSRGAPEAMGGFGGGMHSAGYAK